jgi:hypothetical protein
MTNIPESPQPSPVQLDLFRAQAPPTSGTVRSRRSKRTQLEIYRNNMLETAMHAVFECPRVTLEDFLKEASECFKSASANKKALIEEAERVQSQVTQKGSFDP